MKISFCTTCMGRAHHLRETLPANLADNPSGDGLEVEFVVLNYNSQDGLHEWMMGDPYFRDLMLRRELVYARTQEPDRFNVSHAKNMAHRLATGDIVCNLDADNFTGPDFARFLAGMFEGREDKLVVNPSRRQCRIAGPDESGFYGRVAMSRHNFLWMGGYDESFYGWGYEDTDLIRRAKGADFHHHCIDDACYLRVIPHSNEERVCNMVEPGEIAAHVRRIDSLKTGVRRSLATKLRDRFQVLARPVRINLDGNVGAGHVSLGPYQQAYNIRALPVDPQPNRRSFWGLRELVRARFSPVLVTAESLTLNRETPQTQTPPAAFTAVLPP